MFICKKSGKQCTDRIGRNQKTEKSSSGFTEEKRRVHHTVRTTCKRISEITDQSWKEEEPAGKYSGTAAESIGRTCTDMDPWRRYKTENENWSGTVTGLQRWNSVSKGNL